MQQGEALLWRECRGVPGHRPGVLPGLDLSHREDVRGGDPGRGEDPAAGRVARPPFLQSLDAIGLLEVSKFELQEPKEIDHVAIKSSHALQECISLYRQIERLGRADSDFTAFLHHVGIPSLDMYFRRGEGMFPHPLKGKNHVVQLEHGGLRPAGE